MHDPGYFGAVAERRVAFTRRMQKAGEIMGVRLIDHVIVAGGERWVSLQRRGV